MSKLTRWIPVLALAAPLFAGGFWLQLSDARDGAAFNVRPAGCNHPELAKVTATAEGLVDGKRTSVPLHLAAVGEAGSYRVDRAWPASGRWVVAITAKDGGRSTSAIVPITASGNRAKEAKFLQGVPTAAELDTALRGPLID